MYTLTNGPSKFVAKTRRVHGRHPNFERIGRTKQKPLGHNPDDPPFFEPCATFQNTKKFVRNIPKFEETVITPQHEELINFVGDSWNKILASNPDNDKHETNGAITNGDTNGVPADSNNNDADITGAYEETSEICVEKIAEPEAEMGEFTPWPAITALPASAPYVYNEPASHSLDNFKPFDIDAFWSRRLLQKITENT